MSIIDWFDRRQKAEPRREKLNIPGDLWVKCFHCNEILYLKDLEANLKVCPKCHYHFRITPEERIKFLFDAGSFKELAHDISPIDFLGFVDSKTYSSRIKEAQKKTGQRDAVIIGTALIDHLPANIGIMNFAYMGGSMGSVVGEKITQIIEAGIENKNPVLVFTSSGGARMQEGLMSLMQMAKTSAALARLREAKVPFFSILCDPTTGGTTASFAMLGDVNIAEPGALIGFAGPRVVEQTIRQKLPKGFQRAEFLLTHGMVDIVSNRLQLKATLSRLMRMLTLPTVRKGKK